ncbi:TasA family protein [Ferroacidibacillus organovorans]|uniref:Camelysin metallo-endopeptidase n=1 Tax=Ferroacidibacillus organovorans TaxID=1765683 RepID=A0A853KDE9_9BACL|nr:TasA family protein [Ferroacidibacillus organovorans]KYP81358.1 hypothetical protein AYJ22_00910 [Ferroacidibacillus organovorans]OAG95145.1 hypothetical protein AYW79_01510 [Ferroacidibacillus organovorans]
MKLSTKIPLLSVAGILTLSTLVGGGTFALFTSSSQNTTNTFTAGTLNVTPERDDIPQTGPMFYTSTTSPQAGVVPTGLWAPGDKHTRGLFLENTGTLTARLSSIAATPVDANGLTASNPSANQVNLQNDATFSNQSNVTVWELVPVSTATGNDDQWSNQETSTQIEECLDAVNHFYQMYGGMGYTGQQLLTAVNNGLLHSINNLTAVSNGQTVSTDSVAVTQMFNDQTSNFVNQSPYNVNTFNDVIHPGQSTLLAFTVGFDLRPPTGSGIDPNSMQGKSVYFNFGTNWVQTRNNPIGL